MRATRLFRFGQLHRNAGVTPLDFGRLDETLGAIYSISRQAHQQVGRGPVTVNRALHGAK
jgi:hypothetical protein